MQTVVEIFLLLTQVFGLSAAPAAVTGLLMRTGGTPPRGFSKAFKLAYPAWLLSMAVLAATQWWWVTIMGQPIAETPALLMLGILVCGAYGAVHFVRAGAR